MSTSRWISGVLICALACVATQTASGVALSARGMGQVLLYPYYTVKGGNDTLLTITNTTSLSKALRVRFAEGQNGRDAYSFNLYLAPYDVWAAAVALREETPPAGHPVFLEAVLATSDNSCTVPAINGSSDAAARGVQFGADAFSGANADPGVADVTRTFEGSIEVIEMGTLVPGSPSDTAAQQSDGLAHHCASLVNAWAPGGYWTQDLTTDLANPAGGLYGSAYIINVEQGTVVAYAATALDDFRADPLDQPRGSRSSVVINGAPGSAHPNLADALTDPVNHIAAANVEANGSRISATYAAPDQAVDAVTAVLMAGTLVDDYVTSASIGATTNWIFSYPTRRYYTDPALAGATAIAPFSQLFAGVRQDTSTEIIPFAFYDRETHTPTYNCPQGGCGNPLQSPGTTVELLNLGAGASAVFDSALNMSIASGFDPSSQYGAGWILMNVDNTPAVFNTPDASVPQRFMRPSVEGKYFGGLPILGFAALNFVNGNAQDGILANYSSAITHRVTTRCYTSDQQHPPALSAFCQ